VSVLQQAAHARHLESLSRQQRLPFGPLPAPRAPAQRVLPVKRMAPGGRDGR
jgi:hypothetical protein